MQGGEAYHVPNIFKRRVRHGQVRKERGGDSNSDVMFRYWSNINNGNLGRG